VLKFPSDVLCIMCYRMMYTVTDTCDIHLHKKYETHTYFKYQNFLVHTEVTAILIFLLSYFSRTAMLKLQGHMTIDFRHS